MENTSGLVGQTVAKYQIVEHLGRGGMAEVYKAYQPNLDRYVALKLMHAFLASDPDFIQRFEREAKNVAALRHPNIVQVYDFDVHHGMPFMVMEFIEGGTLKTHLESLAKQGQILPTREAIRIVHEVGEALAYAHKRSMIHRDVKPANVMLDAGGRVILTDFGIAKILTGPSFTQTGATIGTPSYMSPEQSLGKPGDHRSDLYSLGVMLYQLSTGQLPYDADTPLAIMLKHVNEPLPMPRTFNPGIPDGVERIILKSMAKNPDDRFQTAEEMLAKLHDLDAAAGIVIPPASMAAGKEAHADTVAAKTKLGAAVIGAQPTQVNPASKSSAESLAPPPSSGVPLPWIIGGGLGGIVVLALIAFLATGGFGIFAPPPPSASATATTGGVTQSSPATEVPVSLTPAGPPTETPIPASATPDLISTQLASLNLTQQAMLATATPTPTPDATQTAAACVYSYALTAQDPANDKTLAVSSKTTKSLTVQNTSNCAFGAGTLISETTALAGLTSITLDIGDLAVSQTKTVTFEWVGPKQPATQARVFQAQLPTGVAMGEPFTLTFKFVVFNTPTPTRPPATATSAASATPTRGVGLTDIYPEAYVGCVYQGQSSMDYNCTTKLGYVGGTGRMTLYVNDVQIGAFNPGEGIYYNIISRRCLPASYSLRLVDDGSVSQITRGFYFDPSANGGLFPGGACALP